MPLSVRRRVFFADSYAVLPVDQVHENVFHGLQAQLRLQCMRRVECEQGILRTEGKGELPSLERLLELNVALLVRRGHPSFASFAKEGNLLFQPVIPTKAFANILHAQRARTLANFSRYGSNDFVFPTT